IAVGRTDLTIRGELNNGHGTVDGINLRFQVGAPVNLVGDVSGEFNNTYHPASALNRGISRMYPDLPAVFAQSHERTALCFTSTQVIPEMPVVLSFCLGRIHKYTVVFTDDFGCLIAHQIQENLVGSQNGAIQIELDHPLGFINGMKHITGTA